MLDEPVASLDPLARRGFLKHLMESVAENGTSVVLSSHLISDLERVCDYLIVLVSSRVRLAGEVDEVIAAHHRIVCTRREPGALPAGLEVISAEHTDRQSTFVVRSDAPLPAGRLGRGTRSSMEDLVLTYMERAAEPGTGPAHAATRRTRDDLADLASIPHSGARGPGRPRRGRRLSADHRNAAAPLLHRRPGRLPVAERLLRACSTGCRASTTARSTSSNCS